MKLIKIQTQANQNPILYRIKDRRIIRLGDLILELIGGMRW